MKYIQRVPKSASYDYTDIYGYKIYHSRNRVYVVSCLYVRSYSSKEYGDIY